MPAARSRASKAATKPSPKSPKKRATRKVAPVLAARLSLADVMKELEKAGTAQARKTYARHGAQEPMFGTSFATLKTISKRIRVDHELALALWDTGNFDARNLAFKIVDPARLRPADLDRWSYDMTVRMCAGYVSMLAEEGPHALSTASRWLASSEERERAAGWALVSQLAARNESLPDAWFAERLGEIERSVHASENGVRYAMNGAMISIGGRSPALRKAALAAAKRVGPIDVDHGDTSCKTPDVASYVDKMWAHARTKGYDSPSAQERDRESPRTRC